MPTGKKLRVTLPADFPNSLTFRLDSATETDFVILEFSQKSQQFMAPYKGNSIIKAQASYSDVASFESVACGKNYFFSNNSTLQVALTAHPSCVLRVRFVASVLSTVTFSTSFDDFNQRLGQDEFAKRLSENLKINIDQIIVTSINPKAPKTASSTTFTPTSGSVL